MIQVYTDGSCKGNPGQGGFGVVAVDTETNEYICHSKMSDKITTNNEQELLAILYCLVRYGKGQSNIDVYSDSSYAINVYTDWMYRWANNNWLKSDNKKPENLDIIKLYYNLSNSGFQINLHKIKGHNGHKWNELADKLATGEITPEEAAKLYD